MLNFQLRQFTFCLLFSLTAISFSNPHPKVGASSVIITEAVHLGQPERAKWDLVDDLRVTAFYAELQGTAVCLLSYDLCEITRDEVYHLKHSVARKLKIEPDCIHIFCTQILVDFAIQIYMIIQHGFTCIH